MGLRDQLEHSAATSNKDEQPVTERAAEAPETVMQAAIGDAGDVHGDHGPEEVTAVKVKDLEGRLAAERYRIPGLHVAITSSETLPGAVYYDQLEVLRDIIRSDHFCGEMPDTIVDAWLAFLGGRRDIPTDNIKGIYGQPLAFSAPIELARGPLKYIVQATDPEVNAKYSARALLALSTLGDLHDLEQKNPLMAATALRQKLVALSRKPDGLHELRMALEHYAALRPKLNVTDGKLPQADEMARRCARAARELNYGENVDWFIMNRVE